MNNLAITYQKLGGLDKAEQLDKEVFELCKRVLGSEHPKTLISMNNLACSWKAQKRDQDAIDLMLDCVGLSNKLLGSDHPKTVTLKEELQKWQNESPDHMDGESESSTYLEEGNEIDRQDDSPDRIEGESKVSWRGESLEHVGKESREHKRARMQ